MAYSLRRFRSSSRRGYNENWDMTSYSFVEANPDIVIPACEKKIAQIEEERKRLVKKLIEEERRGWFGPKHVGQSDEEVEKFLSESSSGYYFAAKYANGPMTICKNLLALAQAAKASSAGTTVHVSASDWGAVIR